METQEIENSIDETTINGVVKYLFTHPVDAIVKRWNWKAAVLSALMRSPIFLVAYRKEGVILALGAAAAQFFFRTLFGGVTGTIIQAFSKVEPAWHALLTVPLLLASVSHIIEYLVQTGYDRYNGTTPGGKAILVSIIISAISAVFNLFAMRRGALLVKDENQQSLWADIKSFPRITVEFLLFPSQKIWHMFHHRYYLQGVLTTSVTAIGIGLTALILTSNFLWAIIAGAIALSFIIVATLIIGEFNMRKLASIEAEN